jgi:hypothetical protein
MGLSGRLPSVIDFCLGHETSIYAPVMEAILKRLDVLEEAVTPKDIDALFPWAGTRPALAVHLPLLMNKPR